MNLLEQVTLVLADSVQPELALRTIEYNSKLLNFGKVKLLTNKDLKSKNIEIITNTEINDREEYSCFILTKLHEHIDTSHCLIIQTDGFIINPDLWNFDWLEFDYIGAPWHGGLVGNGGFSLRSKRILKICSILCSDKGNLCNTHEDNVICRTFRKELEENHFIKFAPFDIASKFSQEYSLDKTETEYKTFGFHGKFEKFKKYIKRIEDN